MLGIVKSRCWAGLRWRHVSHCSKCTLFFHPQSYLLGTQKVLLKCCLYSLCLYLAQKSYSGDLPLLCIFNIRNNTFTFLCFIYRRVNKFMSVCHYLSKFLMKADCLCPNLFQSSLMHRKCFSLPARQKTRQAVTACGSCAAGQSQVVLPLVNFYFCLNNATQNIKVSECIKCRSTNLRTHIEVQEFPEV